jgi:glycosyltransferase involved in cell wall biosynthesis
MVGNEMALSTAAPLVSIITPFYNTDPHLAECIESVLAQTYGNWEYILINNQSTDSSRSIAQRYAGQDKRLRLIDTLQHLSQVDNFEASLRYMSPEAKYCKMVLADDWIFPECIERMVEVAEANPTVGIVSSYFLYGNEVNGDGLSYPSTVTPGRTAARLMLLHGYYLTGSPNSILLRADVVRKSRPFFPEGRVYEDTEACFQVLAEHDFGFVHQVLTFSREANVSTLSGLNRLEPGLLRKYMFAKQYGPQFLDESECKQHLREATHRYGEFLAESVFKFKSKEFWDFHRRGLQVIGCDFWSIGLPKYIFLEILDIIFNPKKTAGRLRRLLADRRQSRAELVRSAGLKTKLVSNEAAVPKG